MIDLSGSCVLITGGAGFVGSHIADQLLEKGVDKIIVVDNFVRGRKENLQFSLEDGRLELVQGDIRERRLLDRLFKGVDFSFHMAALRITRCAENPRDALEVMYDGYFNVLEACVSQGVKKLVTASSASVYGEADEFPTKETHHPYNTKNLYGAAKMSGELMSRAFTSMYGLQYVAMRYFNIYGPRMDTEGKYTEVLIRWYYLIREGKQPKIFGRGDQTMDFVFVEDVARANILAMESDVSDEVYNVAFGCEVSLKELCFALLRVMESDLEPEFVAVPKERLSVEVKRRLADTRKAERDLGFKASIGLEDGLRALVLWLNENTVV